MGKVWGRERFKAGASACALLISLWLGSTQAAGPPVAPYYSVQLETLSRESLALANLKRVEAEPFARIEKRGELFAVRVGAWSAAADAVGARDRLRTQGFSDAAVIRITNAVAWIQADGRTARAPDATVRAPVDPVANVPRPQPKPAARAPAPEPTAPEAAEALPPGTSWWTATLVSLEDIGLADGLSLENTQGRNEIFLPLPPGTHAQRAELVLHLRFGEALISYSSIQVSVNGTPRHTVRRADADTSGRVDLRIPLRKSDLELEFAKVRLDHTLLTHEDICFARDLVGGYAHVLPDSGLAVRVSEAVPRSVRAAWSLLPREVLIQADLQNLSKTDFTALLELATLLHRDGHEYRIENLPDGDAWPAGQIVLASAERFRQWGLASDGELAANANLRLGVLERRVDRDTLDRRVFVAVSSAKPVPAAEMMRLPWRKASGATLIDVATAAIWPPDRDPTDPVRLLDLGFKDSERRFNFETNWKIGLPYGPLGDGQRPHEVRLMVYAPGAREVDRPVILSAYYNDRLVASTALQSKQGPDVLTFQLPAYLLRARNGLQILAARDEPSDRCRGPALTPQPISVSPESQVVTKAASASPSTFAELVPFQRRLKLYVATDAVLAAPRVVPALVALGEHFWPDIPGPAVEFFAPGDSLAPDGHFLVVGSPKWDPDAPVDFSQGRVRVFSNATREQVLMLDMTSDADYGVLQMVQASGQHGAWLKTTSSYNNLPRKRVLFEDENLAILDRDGVQMGLRVGPTRDYEIEYPQATSWFEAAGRMRTALFVLAWVLVAGLILYLLRQSRRHRAAAKPPQ